MLTRDLAAHSLMVLSVSVIVSEGLLIDIVVSEPLIC